MSGIHWVEKLGGRSSIHLFHALGNILIWNPWRLYLDWDLCRIVMLFEIFRLNSFMCLFGDLLVGVPRVHHDILMSRGMTALAWCDLAHQLIMRGSCPLRDEGHCLWLFLGFSLESLGCGGLKVYQVHTWLTWMYELNRHWVFELRVHFWNY